MFKNVATKVAVFAFTTTTGAAKTGDAANLTCYLSKDYGTVTVLADTSATEMDATNAPGWYLFDVAQTEANCDAALFTGKSGTANVAIVGQMIFTTPASFTSFVTPTGAAVNVTQLLGTAWLTPGTAGTPDVNVKLWNALTTVALPLIPTTAGRTLDVSATGEAGVDWANVGSPTTTLGLTGTTIATSQVVASITGAVGSVTGAVGSVTGAVGSVTGNVGGNVTGSVGSVVGAVGSVTGNVGGNVTGSVGSVVGAVGSVTGNVGGNVTGSVGSVVGLTASNVGSIKTVTDKFAFTVANQVDANIQYVNDAAVTGDGHAGTEWGPA